MKNKQSLITYLLLLIIAPFSTDNMASIVRMEFMFGNVSGGAAYIEIYDQETPATANNFLNYIENSSGERRYDDTFLHRVVTNFIIQGGGFKYNPSLGEFSETSAPHINQDAPVINEFSQSRSNLRGTIAMAKVGGDPDSATSEWFFNLKDNSANLDNQNGGFTVFGEVLGAGMDIIDTIAALEITNGGSSLFGSLPVTNFDPALPITENNLIKIKPSVFLSGYPINFGLLEPTTVSQTQSITMRNSDTGDLIIGNLDLSTIQPPYSVIDNCSGQTLLPSGSCTVDFVFSPTVPGAFSSDITIPVNTVPTPISTVISGRGGNLIPTLEIQSPATPVEFGNIAQSDEIETVITLQNSGLGDLQIESATIPEIPATPFTITNNTCNQNLLFTDTCTVTVKFTESTLGDKTAILSINTIPVEQSTTISLNGSIVLSNANLIIVNRDPIEMQNSGVDFPIEESLSLRNDGTEDLIITGYNFTGTNASNFSISDNCIPRIQPLRPFDPACIDTITFSASTIGDYSAILEISSNDPDSPVTSITLTATVIPSSSNIVLGVDSPLEMSDTGINVISTIDLPLNNDGIGDLLISAYNFTGTNADNFSISEVCLPRILPNTPCTETISFSTTAAGDYASTLEISSNDPDTPISTISIIVNVSEDNDGIRDAIEMAAPNGGDNNRDGIPDAQQDYVASFPDINGRYISISTSQSILLTNIKATDNPSPIGVLPVDPNASISFPYGFYEFKLTKLPADSRASVTIQLHDDDRLPELTTYYTYFSSRGVWLPFDKRNNPATGIGAEFNGNTVTLHFIDAVFGDTDRESGTITNSGGIAFITPTIPSSTKQSSGGCTAHRSDAEIIKHLEWLIILCGLLMYRRLMRKH